MSVAPTALCVTLARYWRAYSARSTGLSWLLVPVPLRVDISLTSVAYRISIPIALVEQVLPNVGCRVLPPGPAVKPRSPSVSTAAGCQERVLNILSWVLLSIRNRASQSRGSAASTGEWDPNALARSLDEAISLLDSRPSSNDMSRCIVVVLQAYFLLLKDDKRRAVMLTEPIADLVGDNPLVLHLPIVWSLMACVRALLGGANRTIAAERLQLAMEPLAPHLGSSSEESVVVQELLRVFNKQKRGSVAAAAGSAGSLAAEGSMLLRQK